MRFDNNEIYYERALQRETEKLFCSYGIEFYHLYVSFQKSYFKKGYTVLGGVWVSL